MTLRALLLCGFGSVVVACGPDGTAPPVAGSEEDGSVTGEPTETTDGTTTGGTTDSSGIDAWIGEYHALWWLTLGVQNTNAVDGAGFTNFAIRADMTASSSSDTCLRDEVIVREYRVEVVDELTLSAIPTDGDEDLTDVFFRRTADCPGMTYEASYATNGETFELALEPGAVCWITRCEGGPSGQFVVEANYCDGEPPAATCTDSD